MGKVLNTLKALFNLKAVAATAALSVAGAMALPFLEGRDEGAPGVPDKTASRSFKTITENLPRSVSKKAAISGAGGVVVVDGFQGFSINKEYMTGSNLYAGADTVFVDTHGGGKGSRYNLTSDDQASLRVTRYDVESVMTAANPRTAFILGCNMGGAGPDDVADLISCDDKRLQTVMMTEGGYISSYVYRIPVLTSHDNCLGRTLAGNANDPGVLAYGRRLSEYLGIFNRSGPLIRYERTADGWENKGIYRGDNRFDLIDPLPVGWLRDAWNATARGPGAVCDELHAINNPANTLGYWDKVSRNLDKPLMSPVYAVAHLASRIGDLIP